MRRFNRFHTALVGALEEGFHASPLSLPQARVLHEIGAAPPGAPVAAAHVARELSMDPGQLSRILSALCAQGLLDRRPDPADARRQTLSLTEPGWALHGELTARADAHTAALLARLDPAGQAEAVGAMARLQLLFGGAAEEAAPPPAPRLRDPRPGELGEMIGRQARFYWEAHGWDAEWERVALEILSRFDPEARPGREKGWIAELDGAAAGCVFAAEDDAQTARLRLLYVDAAARGLGLGHRLVGECMGFARAAGYRRMRLWTMNVLAPARRIYAAHGFVCVEEAPVRQFGQDLMSEIWEAAL